MLRFSFLTFFLAKQTKNKNLKTTLSVHKKTERQTRHEKLSEQSRNFPHNILGDDEANGILSLNLPHLHLLLNQIRFSFH